MFKHYIKSSQLLPPNQKKNLIERAEKKLHLLIKKKKEAAFGRSILADVNGLSCSVDVGPKRF